MSQQLVMFEAPAEKFVKSALYNNSVARPNYQEKRALDLKLIEKGQLEPIIVNTKMVILDGYCRFELLEARGKTIKYIIRGFPTEADELEYVVETNVMRRQLNEFQRVETMYKLYKTQKYHNNKDSDIYKKRYLEILKAVEQGYNESETLKKFLGRDISRVRQILKSLTNEYYLRKTEIKLKNGSKFTYELLPKGEGFLAEKPQIVTTTLIGKIIGVDRNKVGNALYIIDNAPAEIIQRLDNNMLSVGQAYTIIMNKDRSVRKGWRTTDKVECPLCHQMSQKKDFRIIRSEV